MHRDMSQGKLQRGNVLKSKVKEIEFCAYLTLPRFMSTLALWFHVCNGSLVLPVTGLELQTRFIHWRPRVDIRAAALGKEGN